MENPFFIQGLPNQGAKLIKINEWNKLFYDLITNTTIPNITFAHRKQNYPDFTSIYTSTIKT